MRHTVAAPLSTCRYFDPKPENGAGAGSLGWPPDSYASRLTSVDRSAEDEKPS